MSLRDGNLNLTYLSIEKNSTNWLKSTEEHLIKAYVNKSVSLLTKTKIRMVETVLIAMFLIAIDLNFSIPDKNQVTSKIAEIT